MKLQHALLSWAAWGSVVLSLHAAEVNISEKPAAGEKRTPLSLSTNDVLLIQIPSGATAVVQFTGLGPGKAFYRWRYRPAAAQPIQSGQGRVLESYDRKPRAGGDYEVVPKGEHDTTVRAGDIWMEWSQGVAGKAWIYYVPSRAKIEVLKPDAFARDL